MKCSGQTPKTTSALKCSIDLPKRMQFNDKLHCTPQLQEYQYSFSQDASMQVQNI